MRNFEVLSMTTTWIMMLIIQTKGLWQLMIVFFSKYCKRLFMTASQSKWNHCEPSRLILPWFNGYHRQMDIITSFETSIMSNRPLPEKNIRDLLRDSRTDRCANFTLPRFRQAVTKSNRFGADFNWYPHSAARVGPATVLILFIEVNWDSARRKV